MQIILITLSYARAANNLQIILTIILILLKMDEHGVDLKNYVPIIEKNRLADLSASPCYFLGKS